MVIRPRQLTRGVQLFAARTPTLLPATHTNSYALGASEVLLVEPATPYEDERREWLAWAEGLRSQGRRLVGLFVTHHHPDHVGGASFFQEQLGVPIWAHEETARRLPAMRVERRVEDGEVIDLGGAMRLIALHTPGHAPGHLCLHEPESGATIVGDMVASVGTILIEPGDGDMRVYLEQLERLARLGARVALPAHGDPIDQPEALYRHYIAHRLAREEKVARALAEAGPAGATAAELTPNAYADVPAALWPMATLSVSAHLEKLASDGRVQQIGARWVAFKRHEQLA